MANSGKGKILDNVELIMFLTSILLVIAIPLLGAFSKSVDEREVCVIVTNDSKNIVPNVEGRRMIYCVTVDEEDVQYQVADSLFKFRFDSDEFWGKFNRDIEKYEKVEMKFTIAGCRNHLFSWYPDIFEYEIIEDSKNNVLKEN